MSTTGKARVIHVRGKGSIRAARQPHSQSGLYTASGLPRFYYNIQADLARPLAPPLHPVTRQPLAPEDLAPLFPPALLEQEMSQERFIAIPEEVLEIYASFRPTPLRRARRLEQALQTPARIYYKYEGASPTGSHKPNTAIPQAFYNQRAGVRRLATETGAGQWGSALAFAGAQFGLEVMVYMVRASYDQKPYRRILMQTYGAQVVPSPSQMTEPGRAALAAAPEHPGSLGLAISEAVCDAASRPDTHYSLGSVLNHVLLHQSVIGLEAQRQMDELGDYPDVVIGCHGGGSNFSGLALPFMRERLRGRRLRFVAAEPSACPTLTQGKLAYDFGDTAGITPLLEMYTLGHDFVPPPIHAGGLRYHGAAPIVSRLLEDGLLTAKAYSQEEVFDAALLFARCEGLLLAPESAHAIKAALDEALEAKRAGRPLAILFCASGHGFFDMAAYDAHLQGRLPAQASPGADSSPAEGSDMR